MNYINNTFPLFFQIVGINELIFHSKMFKEEPIFDEQINLEDLVFTNQEINGFEESKENLKPISDERINIQNNFQNINYEPTEVISNTNENSNGNENSAIKQKLETDFILTQSETQNQNDEITEKGAMKKVPCGFCGKHISKSSMKLHLRVHTGERPFSCTYCEKKFKQKSQTQSHELTHTREKPFKCKFCERTFRFKSNATKHELTHNGEHQNIQSTE